MTFTNSTLRNHELSEFERAIIEIGEANPEAVANIVRELAPEETIIVSRVNASYEASCFDSYLNRLKQQGLDIGRGKAKYGFRRPK